MTLICHSGAPRSGEPGIHNHKTSELNRQRHIATFVVMDSGPRFARPE
jgi:hypothetical protein